jgi:hypothetical protein
MVQDEWVPQYEDSLIQDVDQPFFEDPMPEQMVEPEGFQPEPMLDDIVEQEFMALEAPEAGMAMPDMAPGPEIAHADNAQPEQFMGLEVFDVDPPSAVDEINQAMDQAVAFQEPEMDPWQQQDDPYHQMNQMMDMQMQYMVNPFQMPDAMGPGYGPMMGPMG